MSAQSSLESSLNLSDNEEESYSDYSEHSSAYSDSETWLYEEDPDNLEPLATEEEAVMYEEQVAKEEEEEIRLLKRFDGELNTSTWCNCSNCSVEHIVKPEECSCCNEFDRCREKMEEVQMYDECITLHPAFRDVCLSKWVLETASIGLKTKESKSYSNLRANKTESEFYRVVAYRQFVRLVWEYVGSSRRIPLTCCVYNKIRAENSSEDKSYVGFEDDEDESQNV